MILSSADPMTRTTSPLDDGAYVLDVRCSLTGKKWQDRCVDHRLGLALAQSLGCSEALGRVLAARGVAAEDAQRFLEPKLRNLMPDPSLLKDMDAAAERLASAVMQGELIGIFADYDVDGATSSALLARFLRAVGGRSVTYVPDRIGEGYGPNTAGFAHLRHQGASLIVTVDCGTTAFEPLAEAADGGLDVIVIDHHAAEPRLPKAVAVVNPNRLDESGAYGHLAAVGMTFLTVVAGNRALREAGWYQTRPEPDLRQWLDLVALGTVCDVVPLKGLNRAFVAHGIAVLGARTNTGLRALADTAGLKELPGAYHLGYVLGPRINAGGRVGKADLGTRLLATDDEAEARHLAQILEQCNAERRTIESAVVMAAITDVESTIGKQSMPLAFAAGADWHPGVIGIVAGRLKERFNCPAVVVSRTGDRIQGSARSVPGVDIGAAIVAARQAGILASGGGHPMAAGFSGAADCIGALQTFLAERIGQHMEGIDVTPRLYLDGVLSVAGATTSLVEALAQAGPWGSGNPEPRFAFRAARLGFAERAGGDHVRCSLDDGTGRRLKAIAFRCMDSALGAALLGHDGAPFHLAGKLRLDSWQGRNQIQLLIDDAAPAWT